MLYDLHNLRISNAYVLNHLKVYLDKVSHYPNFNSSMKLRVYVNSDLDFTCFEAVDYQLGFTAMNYKLIDTIKSKYQPLIIDFTSFKNYVWKI